VRLDEDECWRRVREADHGVLATVHAERGVDLVPVVFAVEEHAEGPRLLVPVDAVKAKSGARLQRLVNVERDARVAVLVERYDEDWQQLGWVRVHATAVEAEPSPDQLVLLAERYEPYRAPGSVTGLLVLEPTQITGWAAG
jgi:PPOX class probable F420-dependent enzyme